MKLRLFNFHDTFQTVKECVPNAFPKECVPNFVSFRTLHKKQFLLVFKGKHRLCLLENKMKTYKLDN